jgi:ribosome maturation factor RimP
VSPIVTPEDKVARQIARRVLEEDYALVRGQDVEVELLVTSQHGPRLVEGTIAHATPLVIMIATKPGGRLVRIPWHAVATIRDATTAHPAI